MPENIISGTESQDITNLQDLFNTIGQQAPSPVPDSVKVNQEVAGDYQSGPNPVLNDKTSGSNPIVDSLESAMNQVGSWGYNPDAYGKTYNYAGGIYGANFDRYYGYGSDIYNKLGFHPYRDNESHYNQNTSWWDDFNRMTSQWVSYAGAGFKSMYSFDGDPMANAADKAMALGMSTKGGVGQFFNNLALSSAYTVGMMGSMILENLAIAGLTPLLGGAGAVAGEGMVLKKLGQFGKGVKGILQTMNRLDDINEARQAYSALKATTVSGRIVDFLNPLSRTTQYAKDIISGADSMKDLTALVKTRKGFGAFYRDLREMNAAYSEALMEGSSAKIQDNREAVDDYYRTNNKMPEGKDAEDIFDKSNKIEAATALMNVGAIYVTNKLVFDDLFRGFKPASVLSEEFMQKASRGIQRTPSWKIGEDAYSWLSKSTGKKALDFLYKSPYLPWSKKYILANFSEGLQESIQDIVANASTNYYTNVYNNPSVGGAHLTAAAAIDALKKQFSIQGLDTFMSGFMMGSLVKGGGAVLQSPKWAPVLYRKYTNSEEFKKRKQEYEKQQDELLTDINNVLKNPVSNFTDNVETLSKVIQNTKALDTAQEDNNEKAFHDIKEDTRLDHLYNVVKMGKEQFLFEHLDNLTKLTDKELSEAFNEKESKAPELRNKITDYRQKILEFKNTYDYYNDQFKNPFDYNRYAKNDPERVREFARQVGFDEARKDVLMAHELHRNTLERMDKLYNETTKDPVIDNATALDFNILMKNKSLREEIEMLSKEITALNQGDKSQKSLALTKLKKKDALVDFRDSLDNFKKVIEDESKNAKKRKTQSEDWKEANKRLYDSFKGYIKVLGRANGQNVSSQRNLNSTFIRLRDYFLLNNESDKLLEAINLLNDPGIFFEVAKRHAAVNQWKRDNHINLIKTSIDALNKANAENTLLNDLDQLNVTPDPEDVDKLFDKGIFETTRFYLKDEGKGFPEVDYDSEIYQKIIDAIKKYRVIKGIDTEPVKEKEEEKVKPESPEDKINNELDKKLLALYRKQNKEFIDEGSAPMFDPALTDEQLIKSKEFQEWKLANSEARDLINKYEIIKKGAVKVEPPPTAEAPKAKKRTRIPVPGLEGLYEKELVLTPDEKMYTEEGTQDFYERITSLKEGKPEDTIKNRRAAVRGEVMDSAGREFLKDDSIIKNVTDLALFLDQEVRDKSTKPGYDIQFTKDAVKNYYDILVKVKKDLADKGLTIYTDIPTLWGELGGKKYAGTIDFLVKDKNGNLFIIDLKTSSRNRRSDYMSGDKSLYKKGDLIQLNAYRELIKQRTGKDVGIYIYPIKVTAQRENITIVNAELNYGTEEREEGGKKVKRTVSTIKIPTDKTIYEILPELSKPIEKEPIISASPGTVSTKETDEEFKQKVKDQYNKLYKEAVTPEGIRKFENALLNILKNDPQVAEILDLDAEKVDTIIKMLKENLGVMSDFNISDVVKGAVLQRNDNKMFIVKEKNKENIVLNEVDTKGNVIKETKVVYQNGAIKGNFKLIMKPNAEVPAEQTQAETSGIGVSEETKTVSNDSVVIDPKDKINIVNDIIASTITKEEALKDFINKSKC